MQPPGPTNLLGRAISAARQARGWTQGEVVGRIPTYYRDERSYRRIESGERTPDRGALVVVLVRGLCIGEAVEINQILALAGYTPLSADETREFGIAGSSSQTPTKLPRDFWVRVGEASGFGPLKMVSVAVAGCCALAILSQETAFVASSALLYGALYAVSILLESEFGPLTPSRRQVASSIFGLMALTSVAALDLDAWLTRIGSAMALVAPLLIFLAAGALQWVVARSVLSESAVVQLQYPSHTAQTAHLKNTLQSLVIVVLFWLAPFNSVGALRREILVGHAAFVTKALGRHLLLGTNFVTLSVQGLWVALLLLGLLSLLMAARLLDNLKPVPPHNVYSALVYLRGGLFFLLALVCLIWYSAATASLST